MTRRGKLLSQLLSGRSDTTIKFEELRHLLLHLGFQERTRGSHHVFVKECVEDMVNLQRDGSLAKSYQVRQVRWVLTRHGLVDDDVQI